MKHATEPNAFDLLNFFPQAFAQDNARMDIKPSKRHPLTDKRTGSDAAAIYRTKRRIGRAHSSSIKKLCRVARIDNGEALLRYGVPTRREVSILKKIAKRRGARA